MGVVVSCCVLLLCGILLYCIALSDLQCWWAIYIYTSIKREKGRDGIREREKDREAAKLIETYIQTYKVKSNENRKRTITSTSYKKKTKIGNNHKR